MAPADFNIVGDGQTTVWIRRALTRVPTMPGFLLTGCSTDECGSRAFVSFFEYFHTERAARGSLSAPSGWNDYYDQWSGFMEDHAEAVREVYGDLFEEFTDSYVEADQPVSGARYLDFRQEQFGSAGIVLDVSEFAPTVGFHGIYGGVEADQVGIFLRAPAPFQPTGAVGGGTGPYSPPAAGVVPVEATTDLGFRIDDDMERLHMDLPSVQVLVTPFFRYLLFDYLLRYLYPNLVEVDDGVTSTQVLEAFPTYLEMLRTIAPCGEVAARLEAEGMSETDADTYEMLCEAAYGDEEGPLWMETIREITPFHAYQTSMRLMVSPGDSQCVPAFVMRPVTGLTLRFGTSCAFDTFLEFDPAAQFPVGEVEGSVLRSPFPAPPTEF